MAKNDKNDSFKKLNVFYKCGVEDCPYRTKDKKELFNHLKSVHELDV